MSSVLVNNDVKTALNKYVRDHTDREFLLSSRVHALQTFHEKKPDAFIKRDDELNFSVSGTKYRKLASLLRSAQDAKDVVMIGSAFSSFLLGASQLLIEKGKRPHLVIPKPRCPINQGNFLLLQTLVPKSQIHIVERATDTQYFAYAKTIAKRESTNFILPEGGCCSMSLAGAMTLGLDIALNQNSLGVQFENIFVDAGTGMSAIGLILSAPLFNTRATIQVVSMAQRKEVFFKLLDESKSYLEKRIEKSLSLPCIKFREPILGKSFGSTNQTLINFIQKFYREEGVLLDPLYSGKLFYSVLNSDWFDDLKGYSLVIHSGGGLNLFEPSPRFFKN